ncbi:MAG: hypothetical protein K8953_00055 [Proteobacteria bacterium]|nr:hypothetical protein [Pseudomonadota bacterium]
MAQDRWRGKGEKDWNDGEFWENNNRNFRMVGVVLGIARFGGGVRGLAQRSAGFLAKCQSGAGENLLG